MSRDIHYCNCGEEIFGDMISCRICEGIEPSSASVKATGQKGVTQILDEMGTYWGPLSHNFDVAADNVKLVKALRRAVKFTDWAALDPTLHREARRCEADVTAILTESDKNLGE